MKSYVHMLPLTAVAMVLCATDVRAQSAVPPATPATGTAAGQATNAKKPDSLPKIGDAESVVGQDETTPIDDADGSSRAARKPADALDAPAAAPGEGKHKAAEDGTILVTGSRLQTGDVTSRLIVIDQADIRARGVTTVEELIRTLPQNVATIGAITNDRSKGPLGDRVRDRDAVSAVGSLGVSAANLGGVGAGNTLVLVNGRRMAGAAGIQDGFVNLNGIPLSAVERVEISTGGASAVYGADALGGVINFVLKKGFSGTSITAQYENSANDADNGRISLFSGKGWKTGNLSLTVDYSRRHPLNNYKSGYTTENYASYFNNDPNYDYRSLARGLQPGVIDQTATVYNPATGIGTKVVRGLTVPKGFTGIPKISDFVTVGSELVRDYVPRLAGPQAESASATFNFEQKLFDRLFVFGNGLYTRSRNVQETRFDRGLEVQLAPGQAYNPFPAGYFDGFTIPTTVYYYPETEIADGTIQPGQLTSLSKSWAVSTGLRYEFSLNSKLEVIYTTSQSTTKADSTVFGSLVSFNTDATSPTGVSCYNFQLANKSYPLSQRAYLQSVFDRQCRALTSTDPATAFNPFKSTSTGGGVGVDVFRYRDQQEDRQSRLQNVEARLNGRLLTLPAGGLYYVVGAELNDDGVDSREVRQFTGQRVSRDRHAFFGELTVPIFSRDFDLPAFRSLTLNVAARRDIYNTEGAIGTVNGIPYDQGGEILYGKNRFARTTPAFGARWEPFTGLALRARFTRGFQAPPYTNLFSVLGTTTSRTLIYNAYDTGYQCTTDCSGGRQGNQYYIVPRTSSPNPDLKPQTSKQEVYSAEWNPHGFLSGLSLAVTYSRNRIFNQYADASDLSSFLSLSEQYKIAQFYPRDANGKITAFNSAIFNISGSRYKSVTYEAAYRVTTGIGTFEPRITYVDNITAETQPFANSTAYSSIGKLLGVDRYKIVGQLNWNYRDYMVNLWAYHTPSYENDYLSYLRNGNDLNKSYFKDVAPMTTIDLTASWQIRRDLRVDLAGRNIFDTAPPFVVVEGRPYDTARYNAAGRTLSLQMQFSF